MCGYLSSCLPKWQNVYWEIYKFQKQNVSSFKKRQKWQ